MRIAKIFCVAMYCLVATSLSAKIFKPYEWDKDRTRYKLSENDISLAELILKHHTQYEYIIQDNQFVLYSTIHRIVYVNNSETVQKHNRIVIYMNNTLELMDHKARSINKEVKIVYFDRNNLKELKYEDSGKAFKIFAIEGIEVGSE